MRNLYLYPGDDLRPLESGEGYKDYLLSDLLKYNNLVMDYGEMRYASEPVEYISGFPVIRQLRLAVVFLEPDEKKGSIDYLVFAPTGFYNEVDNAIIGRFFSNLRIRYYSVCGGVTRPVWVSAFSGDKEYYCRECIPYCTELIAGPVFRSAKNYAELGLSSLFLDKIE